MYSPLSHLSLLVLVSLMVACGGGGGGGDDGADHTPATTPPDATTDYLGTWTLACRVTTPPDPAHPDGVSEDEVLTATRDSHTRFSMSSVTSIYNNSTCSTLTSYYRSFPVTGQVDVVGAQASAMDIDRLQILRNDGSGPVKALARVQGTQLFITRADAAGAVLDAEGYPATLDVSRSYSRAP